MKKRLIFSVLLYTASLFGDQSKASLSPYLPLSKEDVYGHPSTPVYEYEVVNTYPHSTSRYTEGLFYQDGILYESTGLYGKSELIKSDLKTGKAIQRHPLEQKYFGEGATILGEKVYYLTYLTNIGFIYQKKDLKPIGTFRYDTQGWGLATDGKHLIMSDGSSALHFFNPETFKEEKTIFTSTKEKPIGFLNELEYIDGTIYANVFTTYYIALIDSKTGSITGWIDCTNLNPDPETLKYPQVLNGIAYNPKTNTLLVTGKNWPHIYEIKLKK